MNMKHITSHTMMIMVDRIYLKFTGLFALLFSVLMASAQVGDKGVLLTEVGAGLNIYQLQTSQNFVKSRGASTKVGINALYNFHRRVGFGFEVETHNYIEDLPDSVAVNKIGANRMGIGTQFHVLNKKNFALSFGMTVGLFGFNYGVDYPNSSASIKATGVYQNLHVIGRYYFGEKRRLGFFIKGGLINNPMTYKSFELNGENYEKLDGIPISDYRVASTGFHASVGLTYNWRIKNYR